MIITIYRKHPNGPDYFLQGRNVHQFEYDHNTWFEALKSPEVVAFCNHDVVRCHIWWKSNPATEPPDQVCWLNIDGDIWYAEPRPTIKDYVEVVRSALSFYELELRACYMDTTDRENKRARVAREKLYEAEGRLHDFILGPRKRVAEDRAFAWAKEELAKGETK